MEDSVEEKITEKWNESGIFEPALSKSSKKFLITVPYPYVNGSLHVGHGKTYTVADIIARSRRITGYNVLYPMAFHQSGTPLVAYSRRLKAGDKAIRKTYYEHISTYINDEKEIERLLKEFEDPENIADFFANRISKDFMRLGYSIDWTRSFASGNMVYQDFVEWQFNKLMEEGLIVQKDYPILYSQEDGNAVGEDDIKDGDTDKVAIDEYTGIIFKGQEFSLIAATLRPETIFGVTNLWISAEANYVIFRYNGKKYAVSSFGFNKLKFQLKEIEKLSETSAEEIIQYEYKSPITGNMLKVYKSDIVDPDIGTGVVFSVPGHAMWDYAASLRHKEIKPVKVIEMPAGSTASVEQLLSEFKIKSAGDRVAIEEATKVLYREEYYSGKMNALNGKFSGMSVRDAREGIISELEKEGDAIKVYETSRKAFTRSEAKVIVAIMSGQWFIDYSSRKWKELGHRAVDSIKFYPDTLKKNMHDTIDWLKERPCARRRGIGTKLPFDPEWTIESLSDSTIYPILYTVINELRAIREITGKVNQDILDFILLDKDLDLLRKYGKKVEDIAIKARANKSYWYPVDLRVTATPHFSNHLAFYIMHHCAIFPEKYWPKSLMILGLVVSSGAKIGKSKGNAVSLYNTAREYSADVYRLAIAAAADPSSELEWAEDELDSFNRKYQSFCALMDSSSAKPEKLKPEDRWITSSFKLRLARFIDLMEKYDIRNAVVSIFYDVLNDVKEAERTGVPQARAVGLIKKQWLIALSCIIPYASEHYWNLSSFKGFSSTAKLERPVISEEDTRVTSWKNEADKLIGDIRAIIAAAQVEPESIEVTVAGVEQAKIAELVIKRKMAEIEPKYRYLIPQIEKSRKFIDLENKDELVALESFKEYISSTIGKPVTINTGDVNPGAKNAWPGRPLINIKGEKKRGFKVQ